MSEIRELKAKQKKELEEAQGKINLKYLGEESTGVECLAINSKWLCFAPKTKAEFNKCYNHFPPGDENAFLTFAGKDSIETASPFLLCIDNFKHVKNDKFLKAKLKYKTSEGLSIWIELSRNLLDFHEESRLVDVHSKAKYPELYAHFSLKSWNGLSCQHYSGGYQTYHGDKESFKKLFNSLK